MKFAIPAKWDKKALDRLIRINSNNKISEVYGCSNIQPITHGRPMGVTENISLNEIKDYFNFAKKRGLTTNYLLNGRLVNGLSQEVKKYLRKIAKINPDLVTISQPELMIYFSKKFPNIGINISTIANTRTKKDLQKWIQLKNQGVNIKKVVMHNDGTKNPKLKEITSLAHKHKIKVELMVNECCKFNCKDRDSHYIHFDTTHFKKEKYKENCDQFAIQCALRRLNPIEMLDIAGFIDPKHIEYYKQIHNVDQFKIVGRGRTTEEIHNFTCLYLQNGHLDNIFSIVQFTCPPNPKGIQTEDMYYLNSNAYSNCHSTPDQKLTEAKRQLLAAHLISNRSLIIHDSNNYYKEYLKDLNETNRPR